MIEMKTIVGLCLASALLAATFGCYGSAAAKSGADSAVDDARTALTPVKTVAKTVLPSGAVLRLSLIDALATKGKEIRYGPETHLNFTLANSVKL